VAVYHTKKAMLNDPPDTNTPHGAGSPRSKPDSLTAISHGPGAKKKIHHGSGLVGLLRRQLLADSKIPLQMTSSPSEHASPPNLTWRGLHGRVCARVGACVSACVRA
jgi:hypothetical protein